MKITIETRNEKYTFLSERDDYNASELKEAFSRLMVQAGFPPSVIDVDGGHYEYVDD